MVFAPTGLYRFDGELQFPAATALLGSYQVCVSGHAFPLFLVFVRVRVLCVPFRACVLSRELTRTHTRAHAVP